MKVAARDLEGMAPTAHWLGLSHSTANRHLATALSEVRPTTTARIVWLRGCPRHVASP